MFYGNYKDILLVNEEYYINCTMIKKINEEVWKKINIDNQKKINDHLNFIYGNNRDESESESNYYYSSADNSDYSDSEFGIIEDEDLIIDSIKENKNMKK